MELYTYLETISSLGFPRYRIIGQALYLRCKPLEIQATATDSEYMKEYMKESKEMV